MTISKTMLAALAAVTLGGCATQFFGSARVDRGPLGCREQCRAWDMELAGMVKMGEYSDGCICQVRPPASPPASSAQQPSSQAPRTAPQSFAAAAGGAVAGVWMQMQAAEQARQQGGASHGSMGGGSSWR